MASRLVGYVIGRVIGELELISCPVQDECLKLASLMMSLKAFKGSRFKGSIG